MSNEGAAPENAAQGRPPRRSARLVLTMIAVAAVLLVGMCVVAAVLVTRALSRAHKPVLANISRSNLKFVGLTILMYDNDYHAMPPDLRTLHKVGFLKDPMMLSEPLGAKADPQRLDETSFYRYAPLRYPGEDDKRDYMAAPVAWEKEPILPSGQVNVLRLDGSVELMSHDRLASEVARFSGLYITPPVLPPAAPLAR